MIITAMYVLATIMSGSNFDYLFAFISFMTDLILISIGNYSVVTTRRGKNGDNK